MLGAGRAEKRLWNGKRKRCYVETAEINGRGWYQRAPMNCNAPDVKIIRMMNVWMLHYEDERRNSPGTIISLHSSLEGAEAAKEYDIFTLGREENYYQIIRWEIQGSEGERVMRYIKTISWNPITTDESRRYAAIRVIETTLENPRTSDKTKLKKIADYVQLTIDTGGSQYWWDSWCAYVAGNRANKALDTAQTTLASPTGTLPSRWIMAIKNWYIIKMWMPQIL